MNDDFNIIFYKFQLFIVYFSTFYSRVQISLFPTHISIHISCESWNLAIITKRHMKLMTLDNKIFEIDEDIAHRSQIFKDVMKLHVQMT